MPQVGVTVDLRLERGHGLTRAIADAAEDFAVRCAALVRVGRSQIGGVGDNVHLGLAIGPMAGGTVSGERGPSLGDGFSGIGDGALELFGFSCAHALGVRPGEQEKAAQAKHRGNADCSQHSCSWDCDGRSTIYTDRPVKSSRVLRREEDTQARMPVLHGMRGGDTAAYRGAETLRQSEE